MDGEYERVRIPADINIDDHLLGPLTARQLLILAAAGLACWVGYVTVGRLVPLPVAAAAAIVIVAVAVVLAIGRMDGVSLDRLAIAAVRQARAPRRLVPAPGVVAGPPRFLDQRAVTYTDGGARTPAPLRLPPQQVSADGIIDLGASGRAVLLACTTVPIGLRTLAEQQALTSGFGRWLNSLTGCTVQVLIRAERIDLAPRIAELRAAAPALPHPALETAARAHAAFLQELAAGRDLLAHDVLVVVREPPLPAAGRGPGRRAPAGQVAGQLLRRAEQAGQALRAAGVTARRLTGGEALAALAACADPDAPARTTDRGDRAAPDAIVTAAPD